MGTWIELQDIIWSELNQAQKTNTTCSLSLVEARKVGHKTVGNRMEVIRLGDREKEIGKQVSKCTYMIILMSYSVVV